MYPAPSSPESNQPAGGYSFSIAQTQQQMYPMYPMLPYPYPVPLPSAQPIWSNQQPFNAYPSMDVLSSSTSAPTAVVSSVANAEEQLQASASLPGERPRRPA
jgi:hypothetical protein